MYRFRFKHFRKNRCVCVCVCCFGGVRNDLITAGQHTWQLIVSMFFRFPVGFELHASPTIPGRYYLNLDIIMIMYLL